MLNVRRHVPAAARRRARRSGRRAWRAMVPFARWPAESPAADRTSRFARRRQRRGRAARPSPTPNPAAARAAARADRRRSTAASAACSRREAGTRPRARSATAPATSPSRLRSARNSPCERAAVDRRLLAVDRVVGVAAPCAARSDRRRRSVFAITCKPISARSDVSRFIRRTMPSVQRAWPCGADRGERAERDRVRDAHRRDQAEAGLRYVLHFPRTAGGRVRARAVAAPARGCGPARCACGRTPRAPSCRRSSCRCSARVVPDCAPRRAG